MNDAASDAGSTSLTYEEALQVLRLSPEGLRRLADLDEAIAELESARRSLLANRLESIRDAFDASRKDREAKEPGNGGDAEAQPSENEAAGSTSRHSNQPDDAPRSPPFAKPGANGSLGASSGALHDRSRAFEAPSLESDLQALRAELAELRREVAGLKRSGNNRSDAELQQVQRRLTYLEAEIESREI